MRAHLLARGRLGDATLVSVLPTPASAPARRSASVARGPVFPDPHGKPSDAERVRNWRKRIFAPASETAGLTHARPTTYVTAS